MSVDCRRQPDDPYLADRLDAQRLRTREPESQSDYRPCSSCFAHAAGKQDQPPSGSPTRATRTRVAAQASAPVVASVSGASSADRVLAAPARVARERLCPCPTGIATMSGAMPGEDHRRARSVPCVEAISTTSPSRDAEPRGRRRVDLDPAAPHRRGQRVRHLLQPRQVRQRAVEERDEGYGRKWNGILLRVAVELRLRRPARRAAFAVAAPRWRRHGQRRRQRAPPAALLLRLASTRRRPRRPRAASRTWRPSISSNVCHGSVERRLQRAADFEQHVRRGARLVQRPHHRRRHARHGHQRARLGHRLDPRFEERVIRQDQIGERARLVEEAAEADDVRHLLERLAHPPRRRRGEHRVRAVDQQHLRRRAVPRAMPAAASSVAMPRERHRAAAAGAARLELRREEDAARLLDAAEQRVQRVDRQRGEQAVGVRQRRAADDRHRRAASRRTRARAARCAAASTPVMLLHLLRRVVGSPRPSRRSRRRRARAAGGRSLLRR